MITLIALLVLAFLPQSHAIDANLVGTWTSKSGKVITGPAFYNPDKEDIFEPTLTGISYSFTANGYYEEALFRAISNATTPTCPSAIIQWQHGRLFQLDNGSLILTPIAIDGRQVLSRPCIASTTSLTRWNQSELFSKFEVLRDMYNGRMRLNLWQWDGTPVNPMWLAYNPPEMLPTTTLSSASQTGFSTPTATVRREKRQLGKRLENDWQAIKGAKIFCIGLGMMIIGGLMVAVL